MPVDHKVFTAAVVTKIAQSKSSLSLLDTNIEVEIES